MSQLKFIAYFALFFSIGSGVSSCGSKSKLPSTTPAMPNTPDVDLTRPESAPGAQTFFERDLNGKAFSIDGAVTKARALISAGENRRPVITDANTIAYASRRASLERWQVFEADLDKHIERRVSFDAGDSEPVAALGRRLIIASSSDERKSSERVLKRYQEAMADTPFQYLLLEHPARGRRGTEWSRISSAPAAAWIFSADKELKQGLAVSVSGSVTKAYRVAIGKGHEPETRAWSEIKVETLALPPAPPGVSLPPVSLTDGKIFPDGKIVAWTNGKLFWTTNLKGGDPVRLGDDSTPAGDHLTIDPSGQWIVYSAPGAGPGLDLMALHKSGRCIKRLTELPGDETEPVFSTDGLTLFFTYSEPAHSHVIAKTSFGSAASVSGACP